MVYFSTGKRPRIVMFGRDIHLKPARMMIPKDFTVAYDDKTSKFLVKRITMRGEANAKAPATSRRF